MLLASTSASALAQGRPSLDSVANPRATHRGWVTDAAQVLGDQAPQLEAQLAAIQQRSGAEVAVVTLPTIGSAVPKQFATELFNHWGIGRKGHDDGVLVLHVLDQRRVEIETGYGVEGRLPDAKCSWLLHDVAVPFFRVGDFVGGHVALARGISRALAVPEIGHEELVQYAFGGVQPRAVQSVAAWQPSNRASPSTILALIGGWRSLAFLAALAAMSIAWHRRVRAHRALHRNSTRAPKSRATGAVIAVFVVAVICMVVAVLAASPAALALGTMAQVLTACVFAARARADNQSAARRYAPRDCAYCQRPLRLLSDTDDDAYLTGGRLVEERIGAVEYDVWKCACGELALRAISASSKFERCKECGFRTDCCTRVVVIDAPTQRAEGLRKWFYHCQHCNAQREETTVMARLPPSDGVGGGSLGGSSGGGGFGGGGSGGGGAGASY